MNQQEIFTTAFLGLGRQGFVRSSDQNNTCLYRGPNETRCALGLCIPDDEYKPEFEDWPLDSVLPLISTFKDLPIDFAARLQVAHDRGDSPALMEENLRSVAKAYGLVVPPEPYERALLNAGYIKNAAGMWEDPSIGEDGCSDPIALCEMEKIMPVFQ